MTHGMGNFELEILSHAPRKTCRKLKDWPYYTIDTQTQLLIIGSYLT